MNEIIKRLFIQNIANIITIIGIILTFWLIVIIFNDPKQLWLILVFSAIIGLTDFFDGKAARYFNIKSVFGGFLDRVRDKIFICSVLVVLAFYYNTENYGQYFALALLTKLLVVIEVLMELFQLSLMFYSLIKKINIYANQYGRIKMFIQFFILIIWMIPLSLDKYFGTQIMRASIFLIDALLIITIYYLSRSIHCYCKRCIT
ncbi:CDP-alcohol phosphatidyltransferase family protein [Patescibacteria group bacterium]|nr:CDP-alcohol phosphatidyltransferase family protein [Patescibacteria group bacterium]MBU4367351.1 CDP-alcohol phosphatidyltransferase family protein [Patescibacteria group bacterium]MBU4461971.1 CDP-alcohol phosphatidyltransferase family protein [Patescibacteria group bacterium]MCG2699651.1 CDP-alcohol phosphatidyltransferase family protein [Candidatus Parcubacteria bacterium]